MVDLGMDQGGVVADLGMDQGGLNNSGQKKKLLIADNTLIDIGL